MHTYGLCMYVIHIHMPMYSMHVVCVYTYIYIYMQSMYTMCASSLLLRPFRAYIRTYHTYMSNKQV